MDLKHSLSIAGIAIVLAAGSAYAGTGTLPGHTTDKPGSATVGAPPGTAPTSELWTDKNGDGIIQRDEVTPGSQIDKRFKTRDKNNDGQLTSDEYYPPK